MRRAGRTAAHFVLFLFLILNCAVGLSQQRLESKPVVLKGATIIDGSSGALVPNGIIVIEGDKINSVGGSTSTYPSAATVVDLSGKFIIPGLVDSHVHYEDWMGELFLNYGVTAIASQAEIPAGTKEASQLSDTRSPRIYDFAGCVPPELSSSMTQAQVRALVQDCMKKKPDFVRMPTFNEKQLSKQVYQWAAEEVHRAGLLTFGHTDNAPESVRAGLDSIEHIWGIVEAQMSPQELDNFRKGRYSHWSVFIRDWTKLDQMIKEFVDRGVYINPTLSWEVGPLSPLAPNHELETYRVYSDPLLMAYYPREIAHSLLQKYRQIINYSTKYENRPWISRLTPEERSEYKRGYGLIGQFLKRFVQAGGKIQAGTDTISAGTPGICLLQEMDLLVEAGLTPTQALQSATLWPAELMAGKGGTLGRPKIGRIAPGSFADLVVLTANPLQDISNTRKIERVMKGGRFIDFGYNPGYFTFTKPPRKVAMATPEPEISAIRPDTIVEGSSDTEMVVEGVGFVENSLVMIDGIAMPTAFIDVRTLKVKIPAKVVARADPNRFDVPGPEANGGLFGDRTVPIKVYNAPPEGGISNSISLRVTAKWRAGLKGQ